MTLREALSNMTRVPYVQEYHALIHHVMATVHRNAVLTPAGTIFFDEREWRVARFFKNHPECIVNRIVGPYFLAGIELSLDRQNHLHNYLLGQYTSTFSASALEEAYGINPHANKFNEPLLYGHGRFHLPAVTRTENDVEIARRAIRHLFREAPKAKEHFDAFVEKMASHWNMAVQTREFHIRVGDRLKDFDEAYRVIASCMSGASHRKQLRFYWKGGFKIIIVEDQFGTIVGRALLLESPFTVGNTDYNGVYDRIYPTNNGPHMKAIHDWAAENGFFNARGEVFGDARVLTHVPYHETTKYGRPYVDTIKSYGPTIVDGEAVEILYYGNVKREVVQHPTLDAISAITTCCHCKQSLSADDLTDGGLIRMVNRREAVCKPCSEEHYQPTPSVLNGYSIVPVMVEDYLGNLVEKHYCWQLSSESIYPDAWVRKSDCHSFGGEYFHCREMVHHTDLRHIQSSRQEVVVPVRSLSMEEQARLLHRFETQKQVNGDLHPTRHMVHHWLTAMHLIRTLPLQGSLFEEEVA